MSEWSLRYEARPFLVNQVRKKGRFAEAALVKEWRETFCWLAKGQRIPPLDRIAVTVQSEYRPPVADPCAEVLAVKAAVDGLVDARVVPDDSGVHVASVLFLAPSRGSVDSLTLTVRDAS